MDIVQLKMLIVVESILIGMGGLFIGIELTHQLKKGQDSGENSLHFIGTLGIALITLAAFVIAIALKLSPLK